MILFLIRRLLLFYLFFYFVLQFHFLSFRGWFRIFGSEYYFTFCYVLIELSKFIGKFFVFEGYFTGFMYFGLKFKPLYEFYVAGLWCFDGGLNSWGGGERSGSWYVGTVTVVEKIGLVWKCWSGVMSGLLILCRMGDLDEEVLLECVD